MSKHSQLIVTLFSIALFTRLVFFFLVMPYNPSVQSNLILQSDPLGYHLLAQTLAESHEFARQEGGPPNDFRTPGYPLFVSIFYFLFGAKPWIPIFFQLLLDSVSCVLLYTIVLNFSASRIALFSSHFYALDPFLIFFTVTLYSESLFIFLLLLATLYFTKAIKLNFSPPSKTAIAIAALFFGFATLVRPISLFLSIIIPISCFFMLRKNLRLLITSALLFIAVFTLTISPWIIRNLVTFNTVSLSPSGSYNLPGLFVSPMEAERRGLPVLEVDKKLYLEVDSIIMQSGLNPSELNHFQKSKYAREMVFHYIINNPKLFLKHYFIGIIHSFANLSTRPFAKALNLPIEEVKFEIKGQKSLWSIVTQFFYRKTSHEIAIGLAIVFYLLIQYLCLAIGIIVSWRDLNNNILIFCITLAFYFIALAGPYGLARFRLPAIPFYLVFVGVGLNWLFQKMQPKTGIQNGS